ncbi:hypothetical protein V1515DRAFT_600673 [Lipomyces mesembrius]
MFSVSALSISLCLLLAGYLSAICATPPNPNPTQPYKGDRAGIVSIASTRIFTRPGIICLALYHGLLSLFLHQTSTTTASTETLTNRNTNTNMDIDIIILHYICPNQSNLNRALFAWTPWTKTFLALIILVGAPIRLSAYGRLGKNFTFRLAPPDRLVTSGIYRYLQHPSYTGLVFIVMANVMLFYRWDASPACWIPMSVLQRLDGSGAMVTGIMALLCTWGLTLRVWDEEQMLKEKFGKDWERWHRKTKRFVPGVL